MKAVKKYIYTAILLLIAIITALFGDVGTAYAAGTASSSVLDDLTKDPAFSYADYSENVNDYSLKVIQIAESTAGELLLYVYQPSGGNVSLRAHAVNMAISNNDKATTTFNLYNLQYLNGMGVFFKYLVVGVTVPTTSAHTYNIAFINRPFDSRYDRAGSADVTNYKAYNVGQQWYVNKVGGDVTYKMQETETVEIINPETAYLRTHKQHSELNAHYYQDSYYVTFDTNRNIEKLLSATVHYRKRDYYYSDRSVLGIEGTEFWGKANFSNERFETRDIYADDAAEYEEGGYLKNDSFSWSRIQRASAFAQNSMLSDKSKETLNKHQWVLLFEEVSVYQIHGSGLLPTYEETGQVVDQTTILRLEFIENGVTYNLGTVSNTVSSTFKPGDVESAGENFWDKIKAWLKNLPWWVWLIVALVVVGILSIFIKPVFLAVKFLLKGLWLIISAPFRLIIYLAQVGKRDDKRNEKYVAEKRKK